MGRRRKGGRQCLHCVSHSVEPPKPYKAHSHKCKHMLLTTTPGRAASQPMALHPPPSKNSDPCSACHPFGGPRLFLNTRVLGSPTPVCSSLPSPVCCALMVTAVGSQFSLGSSVRNCSVGCRVAVTLYEFLSFVDITSSRML